MPITIDAHQHFFDVERFAYTWMSPDMPVLRRNYLPGDLKPLMDEAGIDRTVFVQALHDEAETRWALEMAREHAWIAGVVGWVDLTSPAVSDALDALGDESKLVGVRHITHDEPDDDWIVRDDVLRGLREVMRRGLTFDLLFRPQHLKHAPTLAAKLPELRLVIDHIAKPPIARGEMDGWLEDMTAAARCGNVWCKLSGMITEADPAHWRADDLRPFVERVVELFGFDRLMFGSDWPVCRLAGSYQQVIDALNGAVGAISDSERAKLFGETASGFYGLKV